MPASAITGQFEVLIISDLHLESGREDITATLIDLLRSRARGSDRLYILGDLFEVWIGDDDDQPLARRIADALQELHRSGTDICIMHGNRDFLLGKEYAHRCGATLIEEPFVFEHQGERIALLHGDILCTADRDYLAFRTQVRDPAWQQTFLARPLSERNAIARDLRRQSMENARTKSMEIMDVSEEAVGQMMNTLQLTTLIHGHTHRPAEHRVKLASGKDGRRIVLGDWDRQGWLIEVSDSRIKLENFPLLAGAGRP